MYIHKVYSGLSIKQLITIKIFIYCQYDLTSNKTQSGFVHIIEAQDVFQMLVDWHNHDNSLDNIQT